MDPRFKLRPSQTSFLPLQNTFAHLYIMVCLFLDFILKLLAFKYSGSVAHEKIEPLWSWTFRIMQTRPFYLGKGSEVYQVFLTLSQSIKEKWLIKLTILLTLVQFACYNLKLAHFDSKTSHCQIHFQIVFSWLANFNYLIQGEN